MDVFDRKAVLRARHTDSPSTVEARGGLRPNVACKNRKRRIRALEALRAFRDAYRDAFARWVTLAKGVVFPEGTYRLRLFGVPCEPFALVQSAAS